MERFNLKQFCISIGATPMNNFLVVFAATILTVGTAATTIESSLQKKVFHALTRVARWFIFKPKIPICVNF
jgi:hypothetical protein